MRYRRFKAMSLAMASRLAHEGLTTITTAYPYDENPVPGEDRIQTFHSDRGFRDLPPVLVSAGAVLCFVQRDRVTAALNPKLDAAEYAVFSFA